MARLRYKQSGKGIGHIIDVITSARPWSLRLRRTVPGDQNLNSSDDIPKDKNGNFAPYNDGLYAHEYGHYLQSQSVGWLFLIKYGIPSLWSAIINNGKKAYYNGRYIEAHHISSSEIEANRRSSKYFMKRGYLDQWKYEYDYPTY